MKNPRRCATLTLAAAASIGSSFGLAQDYSILEPAPDRPTQNGPNSAQAAPSLTPASPSADAVATTPDGERQPQAIDEVVEVLPAPEAVTTPRPVESESRQPDVPASQPQPRNAIAPTDGNWAADRSSEPAPRLEPRLLPTERGYEVLERGPVHEAFGASDVSPRTVPMDWAATPPPEPLQESIPAKPSGMRGGEWIPGYWNWEPGLERYIWISGLWREVPPGRQWSPGFWSETAQGFAWTHGYWADSSANAASAVRYLPAPPQTAHSLPSGTAKNDSSFWFPGEWSYDDGQYSWKSGYWSARHADWIWQPSCYLETPGGFVYVSGYWDYVPTVRGIPYAPIIPSPIATVRSFTPAYAVASSSQLLVHLFVHPGQRCYYFGDFYSAHAVEIGFRPWYRAAGGASLPTLDYYNWLYRRQGISFVDSMARYDDYYRLYPDSRPAFAVAGRSSVAAQVLADPLSANVGSFEDIVRRETLRRASPGNDAIPSGPLSGNSSLTPGDLSPNRLTPNTFDDIAARQTLENQRRMQQYLESSARASRQLQGLPQSPLDLRRSSRPDYDALRRQAEQEMAARQQRLSPLPADRFGRTPNQLDRRQDRLPTLPSSAFPGSPGIRFPFSPPGFGPPTIGGSSSPFGRSPASRGLRGRSSDGGAGQPATPGGSPPSGSFGPFRSRRR